MIDTLEIVEKFVTLKKKGAIHVACCPLHDERSPSFVVHPAKNIYKCFGCGKGGDAIDFVMNLKNMGFIEARDFVTQLLGKEVEVYKKERVVVDIKPDYIPNTELYVSVDGNLFTYLNNKIGYGFSRVWNNYLVCGLESNWNIFWYVDFHKNIRSGKYMKYTVSGRRDKESTTSWEHKKRDFFGDKYPDFIFSQCFFGEHLLAEDIRKPVAIVESEKTALVASFYIDKYIWLACGSKNGLTRSKCAVLENRSVTLFPDLGAYAEWSEKAKEFKFNISDNLEKVATQQQRDNGYDLADFLLDSI